MHLVLIEMLSLCRVSDLMPVGTSLQPCIFLGNRTDNGIQNELSVRIGVPVENCCDRYLKAGRRSKEKHIQAQPRIHRH